MELMKVHDDVIELGPFDFTADKKSGFGLRKAFSVLRKKWPDVIPRSRGYEHCSDAAGACYACAVDRLCFDIESDQAGIRWYGIDTDKLYMHLLFDTVDSENALTAFLWIADYCEVIDSETGDWDIWATGST